MANIRIKMQTIIELSNGAAHDAREAARLYEQGDLDQAQHFLLRALYKNGLIKKLRRPNHNGNGNGNHKNLPGGPNNR